jgi:hypothetical protein
MKNNYKNNLKFSTLFNVIIVPILSFIIVYQLFFISLRLLFFILLHVLKVILNQTYFSFIFINESFEVLIPHTLIFFLTFSLIILIFIYLNKILSVRAIYKLIRFFLFLGYIIIPVNLELNYGMITELINQVLSFQIFELIDTLAFIFSEYVLMWIIILNYRDVFSEFDTFPTFSLGVEILSLRKEKEAREETIKEENTKVLKLFEPKQVKFSRRKYIKELNQKYADEKLKKYVEELERLKKEGSNS